MGLVWAEWAEWAEWAWCGPSGPSGLGGPGVGRVWAGWAECGQGGPCAVMSKVCGHHGKCGEYRPRECPVRYGEHSQRSGRIAH